MTLDILKSEALKLQRTELFDFVQFILQSLKEKESAGEIETPDWLKTEISKRAAEMKSGEAVTFTGQQVHQEIIDKHGFDIPASLLG
jgi:Putative addiction module component